MMASTYAIAVRDDPHMKGDYNEEFLIDDCRLV